MALPGLKLRRRRLHRCNYASITAAVFLACVACTNEKTAVTGQYPHEKILPNAWRALKAVRDSYKPMPDLNSLYEDRKHGNGLPYHVFVPASLVADKAYPLVIFLHGHTDLSLDTHGSFPKGVWSLPDVQAKHPHVLFVPRHRTVNDDWNKDAYRDMVMETLDNLITEFDQNALLPDIDVNRLYLTGFSMGAMATWDYVKRFPHKFAAAAPLSGYFHGPQNESEARSIKHVPIWIFNGGDDDGVTGSRSSYELLKKAGAADVRYHEFVDHGHVIDDFAFFTDGFFDWLFAQQKK